MTTGSPPPTRADRTRPCPKCGALNGADFDRCVRCGNALSALAVSADRARKPLVDAGSLWASKVIAGFTLLVFAGQVAAELAAGGSVGGLLMRGNGLVALRFGALEIAPLGMPHPLRLLSAVFVHYGVLHVGLNLLALGNLARVAEPMVGSARFAIVYVVTGVLGFATTAATSMYFDDSLRVVQTAGASGAVFGIMGLLLGTLLRRRDPRWRQFLVQAVLYAVVFGFALNASRAGIRVNNSAHIGGLVVGTLAGLVLRDRPRSELAANFGAVVCLLASVASVALAQRMGTSLGP